MRAPPPSLKPTTGTPHLSAVASISTIFAAWRSPTAPPPTVKSCEKEKTARPATSPLPVTTPSAGNSRPASSGQRCFTHSPNSTKESSSKSSASRSRAVSLPCSCWRATRSSPPPPWRCTRRASRSSKRRLDIIGVTFCIVAGRSAGGAKPRGLASRCRAQGYEARPGSQDHLLIRPPAISTISVLLTTGYEPPLVVAVGVRVTPWRAPEPTHRHGCRHRVSSTGPVPGHLGK